MERSWQEHFRLFVLSLLILQLPESKHDYLAAVRNLQTVVNAAKEILKMLK